MVGTGILSNNMRSPSRMLHDIPDDNIYSDTLHGSGISPKNSTLLLIWTLVPNLNFYLIARGFHGTFATDAACQQRTLTTPDTCYRCGKKHWNDTCPAKGQQCRKCKKHKKEVPRDVRNSKVRKQDKFRRDWSQH